MQHSLAGEEACCLDVFFPYLADLHVDKVEDLGDAVLITARSRAPEGGLSPVRIVLSPGQQPVPAAAS